MAGKIRCDVEPLPSKIVNLLFDHFLGLELKGLNCQMQDFVILLEKQNFFSMCEALFQITYERLL